MLAAVGIVLAAGLSLPARTMVTEVGDFVPEAKDIRMQLIHKVQDGADWPFLAERGVLACVKLLGRPTVYFLSGQRPPLGKAFVVDTDVLRMSLGNLGTTNVLKPYESFEVLIKRMAPFVTMGQRLCALPPGTIVPDSEL